MHKIIFQPEEFQAISISLRPKGGLKDVLTVMGSSSHEHRSLEGFIVLFILEGRVGRDIPLNASFEVQELTGERGG